MQITYSASITFFIVTAVGTALAGYPRLAFILFMSAAISLGARSLTRRCRGRVVKGTGRSKSCITPENVKKYRRQHPGVGIKEAVEALRAKAERPFPCRIGLSSRK